MSKAKRSTQQQKPVIVEAEEGETEPQTMARVIVAPYWRHAFLGKALAEKSMGKVPGDPQFVDFADAIKARANETSSGDLRVATNMLVAQAHSLDSMFAEFARRSAINMGDYINASEIYARLALKAQANCRATLEALMKLHQPREQTVKHVHVNDGGQAVVADHFHAGGRENGESIKQCHATEAICDGAALPGPDPERDGVPVPCREGKAAMQNARRD